MVEGLNIEELEKIVEYNFHKKELLKEALTHSTYAYESRCMDIRSNQRLEFLGDSVLNMVVASYLFNTFPHFPESELTRWRALLVNKDYLGKKAEELGVYKYILLGKGEERQEGRKNYRNLSGALEAIIGALYLDGGLSPAENFIINQLIPKDVKI